MDKEVLELYFEICGDVLNAVHKSVARSLMGTFVRRRASTINKDERGRVLKLARINLNRSRVEATRIDQLIKQFEVHLTAARAQGAFSGIALSEDTDRISPATMSAKKREVYNRKTQRRSNLRNVFSVTKTEASASEGLASSFPITSTADVITARFAGLNLALDVGFRSFVATRIATAISELSRNIALYAGEGTVKIERVSRAGTDGVRIEAIDSGSGIENLQLILNGGYTSKTGLGIGLKTVRELADEFDIDSGANGTKIVFVKWNS